MLVDLGVLGQDRHGNEITGKLVEKALDKSGIHCNKNMIPYRSQAADDDQRHPPGHAGRHDARPAPAEFEQIARWIAAIAKDPTNADLQAARVKGGDDGAGFPVPAYPAARGGIKRQLTEEHA